MMHKSGLPMPGTTASTEHGITARWGLSKRALKLVLSGALVLVTLSFYTLSSSAIARNQIDMAALERILEDHASSVIVGSGGIDAGSPYVYDGEGLTSLGLEADESFDLGSTSLVDYRAELEEFVVKAFPSNYQKDAMSSLLRHLDESSSPESFPSIPHKYVPPKLNSEFIFLELLTTMTDPPRSLILHFLCTGYGRLLKTSTQTPSSNGSIKWALNTNS